MAVKNLFELSRMQNKNTKKQHRSKKQQHKPKKYETLMKILLQCHDFFILGTPYTKLTFFFKVENTTYSRRLRARPGPYCQDSRAQMGIFLGEL